MIKEIKNKKKIIIVIVSLIMALIIIKLIDIYYQKENKNEEQINYNEMVAEEVEDNLKNEEDKIVIYITGEVVNQGVIELEYGSRISDAIEKAGGITETANINNVNLAYKLEDGQKIYIPNINETEVEIVQEGEDGVVVDSSEDEEIININNATSTQLQNLQGIGETLAQNIIDYREENGRFKNIEELMNVPGIGEGKFNNIKEQIKVR